MTSDVCESPSPKEGSFLLRPHKGIQGHWQPAEWAEMGRQRVRGKFQVSEPLRKAAVGRCSFARLTITDCLPQTRWLKQQKFILPQPWRLGVRDQGVGRIGSFWADPLPGRSPKSWRVAVCGAPRLWVSAFTCTRLATRVHGLHSAPVTFCHVFWCVRLLMRLWYLRASTTFPYSASPASKTLLEIWPHYKFCDSACIL